MLPIRNRISDVMMAGESRPFDAVLKDIFEKPRVVKHFADFYLRPTFRQVEHDYFDFNGDDPVEFLKDEFRPSQETWFADKIFVNGLFIAWQWRALEDVKMTFLRGSSRCCRKK